MTIVFSYNFWGASPPNPNSEPPTPTTQANNIGTYFLNGPKRRPDFGTVFRLILERIGAHAGLERWYPGDFMPVGPFPCTVGRYPDRPGSPGQLGGGARADSGWRLGIAIDRECIRPYGPEWNSHGSNTLT